MLTRSAVLLPPLDRVDRNAPVTLSREGGDPWSDRQDEPVVILDEAGQSDGLWSRPEQPDKAGVPWRLRKLPSTPIQPEARTTASPDVASTDIQKTDT